MPQLLLSPLKVIVLFFFLLSCSSGLISQEAQIAVSPKHTMLIMMPNVNKSLNKLQDMMNRPNIDENDKARLKSTYKDKLEENKLLKRTLRDAFKQYFSYSEYRFFTKDNATALTGDNTHRFNLNAQVNDHTKIFFLVPDIGDVSDHDYFRLVADGKGDIQPRTLGRVRLRRSSFVRFFISDSEKYYTYVAKRTVKSLDQLLYKMTEKKK